MQVLQSASNEYGGSQQAADHEMPRLTGLKITPTITARLHTEHGGGDTLRHLPGTGSRSFRTVFVRIGGRFFLVGQKRTPALAFTDV